MTSTEFHELVAWARLGEICQNYLHKGKLIYVEGYLKTRSKVMPDGTKKFRTEIVVQDMIMLEKRSHGEGGADESEMMSAPAESEHGSMGSGEDMPISDDVFEG